MGCGRACRDGKRLGGVDPSGVESVVCAVESIVMLSCAWTVNRRIKVSRPEEDHFHHSVDRVRRMLVFACYTWFALYFLMLIHVATKVPAICPAVFGAPASSITLALVHLANGVSYVPLIGIYRELAFPTRDGEPPSELAIGAQIAAVVLTSLLSAALAISELGVDDPKLLLPYHGAMLTFGGLAGGIVVATLAGRLDSKFIGLSGSVAVAIFSYAIVQPLYHQLFVTPAMGALLLAVAFALKLVLVTAMAWAIHNDRLRLYALNMRFIHKHMSEIRRDADRNDLGYRQRVFGWLPAQAARIANEHPCIVEARLYLINLSFADSELVEASARGAWSFAGEYTVRIEMLDSRRAGTGTRLNPLRLAARASPVELLLRIHVDRAPGQELPSAFLRLDSLTANIIEGGAERVCTITNWSSEPLSWELAELVQKSGPARKKSNGNRQKRQRR